MGVNWITGTCTECPTEVRVLGEEAKEDECPQCNGELTYETESR